MAAIRGNRLWILCILLACWLAIGVAVQAQTRSRLGENVPKTAPDPTSDYVAIFEEARKLYGAGKLDEALQQVEVVLAKYPHYSPAVQLRALLVKTLRNDTSRLLRQKLDRIVIPRVNFKDALVEAALDFLRDETRRLDRDGKGVNIVVLLPDEIRKRKITLDLIDARASDVLEYLAEGGGFKYRIERSAVVVTGKEGTNPAAPSSPSTGSTEPPPADLPLPIPGA